MIDTGIEYYGKALDGCLATGCSRSPSAMASWPWSSWSSGRSCAREFFPEVDAGAFEMYVRAASGLRIEETEKRIKAVEANVSELIEKEDLQLVLSELGVTSDWSAAYTPNAGPMDAVVKIQLTAERTEVGPGIRPYSADRAQQGVRFSDLEFAFDAGGMVRSAMNEGKSTPITIRVTGKDQKIGPHDRRRRSRTTSRRSTASSTRGSFSGSNYPQYLIKVDRAKAAELGLTQDDVMKNVVAAFNSSIQFNKHNFWIDPKSKNQYFVGVQYFEKDIKSIETLLDIPITTNRPDKPRQSIPLRNVVTIEKTTVPTEVTHYNIQPTIELTMGVYGRDLGHVSDDVQPCSTSSATGIPAGMWSPYDPDSKQEKVRLPGSQIVLTGEYLRMKDTFNSLAVGLTLCVALDLLHDGRARTSRLWCRSAVMAIVPLCLIGILPMLVLHGLGGQRAVAAGLRLQRRHQGGQHDLDDRLRPGAATA